MTDVRDHETHHQPSLFPGMPVFTSWIYFALADNHQWKIGYTARIPLARRGGELRAEIINWIAGDRATEQRVHDYYDRERIGETEWFRPSLRLLLDAYGQAVRHHGRRSRKARRVRAEIEWYVAGLRRQWPDHPEAAAA